MRSSRYNYSGIFLRRRAPRNPLRSRDRPRAIGVRAALGTPACRAPVMLRREEVRGAAEEQTPSRAVICPDGFGTGVVIAMDATAGSRRAAA